VESADGAQSAKSGLPSGTPRRRIGNFRTPELAARVQEVLAEAGVPSSRDPDPRRPEPLGRLLDWLVHLTGVRGNRVWVPRERFREAVRTLNQARRAGR
jgi:hypothetical protein